MLLLAFPAAMDACVTNNTLVATTTLLFFYYRITHLLFSSFGTNINMPAIDEVPLGPFVTLVLFILQMAVKGLWMTAAFKLEEACIAEASFIAGGAHILEIIAKPMFETVAQWGARVAGGVVPTSALYAFVSVCSLACLGLVLPAAELVLETHFGITWTDTHRRSLIRTIMPSERWYSVSFF